MFVLSIKVPIRKKKSQETYLMILVYIYIYISIYIYIYIYVDFLIVVSSWWFKKSLKNSNLTYTLVHTIFTRLLSYSHGIVLDRYITATPFYLFFFFWRSLLSSDIFLKSLQPWKGPKFEVRFSLIYKKKKIKLKIRRLGRNVKLNENKQSVWEQM